VLGHAWLFLNAGDTSSAQGVKEMSSNDTPDDELLKNDELNRRNMLLAVVRKGDLLMVIDPTNYQIAVDQAAATVRQDQQRSPPPSYRTAECCKSLGSSVRGVARRVTSFNSPS
jgi:hypothetical protein